jgi:hypothetical protein
MSKGYIVESASSTHKCSYWQVLRKISLFMLSVMCCSVSEPTAFFSFQNAANVLFCCLYSYDACLFALKGGHELQVTENRV